MNPARIRRLRSAPLLLLVPLLMASPSSPFASTTGLVLPPPPPDSLVFTSIPPLFVSGLCTPLQLELQGGGAPTPAPQTLQVELGGDLFGGRYYASADCSIPVTTVSISQGATGTQVWFRSWLIGNVMLLASAPLLEPDRTIPIPATAGPATHLKLQMATQARAGEEALVTVAAFDAASNLATGYTGTVHFTTTALRATLPRDYTFTDADDGQRTFPVTFFSAGTATFAVEDISPQAPADGASAGLRVVHNDFARLALSSLTPLSVSACSDAILEVKALDAYDNTVREQRQVTLCKAPDRQAKAVDFDSLQPATSDGRCIYGFLDADAGFGRVRWVSDVEEDVAFTVVSNGLSTSPPVTVSWKAGQPDATKSDLQFPDSPGTSSPTLKTVIQKLPVLVELRNACGALVRLPPERFAFAGDRPLDMGPASAAGEGRWTTVVQLPECPTDPSTPLALWPLVDNAPLWVNDRRFEKLISPLCADIRVKLSARPKDEHTVAGAGLEVEFLVDILNEGLEAIPTGLLQLETSGLRVLEAKLDDRLPPGEKGFSLPDLHRDELLTVRVKAQATAQLDQPATATVWYASSEGIKLTPKQTVTFERGDVGVDVGCGCQAGDLPSQFLPWLALLLATSRPWERLRRLRRGKKIDHQAPWQ